MSFTHCELAFGEQVLHFRLQMFPSLRSRYLGAITSYDTWYCPNNGALFHICCLLDVFPVASSFQQLTQPAGFSPLLKDSLNSCMCCDPIASVIECVLVVRIAPLASLRSPLYIQQGLYSPVALVSRLIHGNGHILDFKYFSTTLMPFCSLLVFSLCLSP